MSQSEIHLKHAAKLARLELSDAELQQYEDQLSSVLDYMQQLERQDLSSVEPTAHAAPVFDVWREDEARTEFTPEQALLNAPKKAQQQFLITRVIEE